MKYQVLMVADHQVVIPETTLDTIVNDVVVQSIPVPEKTINYKCGQVFTFNNKKSANEFIKELNGKAEFVCK